MYEPVKDVLKLGPMVEKAIRGLYGQGMQNIKIVKADQFPLFKEPKQGWLVHVEFNDDKYEYAIQIEVQHADGRITRSHELHRSPLKK
jgi:hypothetical protein